jgi:hypothetical protein
MYVHEIPWKSPQERQELERVTRIPYLIAVGLAMTGEIDHDAEMAAPSDEVAQGDDVCLDTAVRRRIRAEQQNPHAGMSALKSISTG